MTMIPSDPQAVPPRRRSMVGPLIIGGMVFLFVALHFAVDTRVQQWETRALGAEAREVETQDRVKAAERRTGEVEALLKARETQWAQQAEELAQRERAIGGRENAATERTQSSLQGLLIQQQLIHQLEALKASLPDLTPEMEKLTREHAQMKVEIERLKGENAALRSQGAPPNL